METNLDYCLRTAFRPENIFYYAALPFEACRVINQRLLDKLTFKPRTAVIFLIPYYSQDDPVNVARFAMGGDYHHYAKQFFSMSTPFVKIHSNGYQFQGYCDHSPIDERHAAATAGLGIIGDNGLLIHPEYGSYVFIAEWLTDAPPEDFRCVEPQEIRGCEHCGACISACPAGVLPGGSRRKCLSAITQKKADLTEAEAEMIRTHGSAWGCDVCQNVCPHNRQVIEEQRYTPVTFFRRSHIPCMTTDILTRMADEEYALRPFSYRPREVLARNLELLGY